MKVVVPRLLSPASGQSSGWGVPSAGKGGGGSGGEGRGLCAEAVIDVLVTGMAAY